ncbi:E3 ubiquitin-protein ligase RNF138-like isoform X2 [Hoplias malabaricus]|uniref:E3 ubiquitin-protein ligase RNF138-like isoform X2 n=1 Tax=Hoplias malabaricus TaxID=27720 RepID=UPI003461A67A
MSMESSAEVQTSNSDADEDYDCPVCQDILRLPVRTKSCGHVFCKRCFEMAVKSQGPHCPLCRSPVSERVQRATDVQTRMRERKGKCRACGKEKLFSKMRQHYKSCRIYIEEYGLITDSAPSNPAQTLAQTPVQTQAFISGFIPSTPVLNPTISTLMQIPLLPQAISQGTRAGRVYSCPYCPLEELRDMALVQHCIRQHGRELTPANEEQDEDVQICQALQTSVHEF